MCGDVCRVWPLCFEVASRSNATLQDSCRVTLSALGVGGTRNILVTVDETVWQPMYDVVSALRPEPAPQLAYVGGFFSNSEDWSFIKRGTLDLPNEKLSKVAVHFTLSRTDTNQHVYCVDMIPRAPKKAADDEQSTQGVDFSLETC